ncbi:hypothetical protein ADIS_2901 [Lunatimonas lonarensis]|uniref:Uncharacterized protein n=1 Tax=Lunatimonas lonarensis TaxID=1232681 RepID=R7ZQQ0_9BACT|nr:hypothetical protein ADIS_2901 [Lunatimonas lonarensis]
MDWSIQHNAFRSVGKSNPFTHLNQQNLEIVISTPIYQTWEETR